MQNYLDQLERANQYLKIPQEKLDLLKRPERIVEVNFRVIFLTQLLLPYSKRAKTQEQVQKQGSA